MTTRHPQLTRVTYSAPLSIGPRFCPSQGVVSCEKMADDSEKRLEVLEELHEQDVVQC